MDNKDKKVNNQFKENKNHGEHRNELPPVK